MAWKEAKDFREDYPGGYSRNGDVFDGNGYRIGYVCGDGDYHIVNDPNNDGQYYHMRDN